MNLSIMPNYCHEKCETWRARGYNKRNRVSPYELGFKRCRVCSKMLDWEGTRCPCCGAKLGTKPISHHSKRRLNELGRFKRIG